MFAPGILDDCNETKREIQKLIYRERERESFMEHGRDTALSGDEYECMKMKRLSQYGDSAGTSLTEECSATPPGGTDWLLGWIGASSIFTSLGSGRWQYECRARTEYRCSQDWCSPNRGSELTSQSQLYFGFLGHNSRDNLENRFSLGGCLRYSQICRTIVHFRITPILHFNKENLKNKSYPGRFFFVHCLSL